MRGGHCEFVADAVHHRGGHLLGGHHAQLGLVDLADVGHGHSGNHGDGLGPRRGFVDPRGGERQQFCLGHHRARHQQRKDHGQLARIRVGRAHGGAQLHRRVRAQRVFNHLGVDVVATADDQVLGSPAQVQAPFGVQPAQVPRGQPAVGSEGLGGVFGIEKAGKHIG